jgi:hypothetical protein
VTDPIDRRVTAEKEQPEGERFCVIRRTSKRKGKASATPVEETPRCSSALAGSLVIGYGIEMGTVGFGDFEWDDDKARWNLAEQGVRPGVAIGGLW